MDQDRADVKMLFALSKTILVRLTQLMELQMDIIEKKDKHAFGENVALQAKNTSKRSIDFIHSITTSMKMFELLCQVPDEWSKQTTEERNAYLHKVYDDMIKEVQTGVNEEMKKDPTFSNILSGKNEEPKKELEVKEPKKEVEIKEELKIIETPK
jgi:hypothetical protein